MAFWTKLTAKDEDYYEDETEQDLQNQIRFDKQVKETFYTRPRPNPENMVETARWSRENRKMILGR